MILPTSVDLRKYILFLHYQQTIQSCTANATVNAIEILLNKHGMIDKLSAIYLYYYSRKIENRLGQKGSNLNAVFNALSVHGIPSEKHWAFNERNADYEPYETAQEEAKKYVLHEYERVTPALFDEFVYSIKEWISKEIPVIITIRTGRMFWRIKGNLVSHIYKPVNNLDNQASVDHALVIVGYDDNLNGGSWIVANDATTKWGDKGFGAIGYDTTVDFGEAWVIKKIGNIDVETTEKNFHNFDK